MSAERRPGRFSLEEVVRLAREETLKRGSHVPMVIAQGSQKSIVGALPELPGTHEERVRTMFAAAALLGESGQLLTLDEVFFVSEGWMSTPEPDGTIKLPPSQDPKRIEVLVIASLNVATRRTDLILLEMVRDSRGQVVDLKRPEGLAGDEGSFAESPLLETFVEGFQLGTRRTFT